MVFVEIDKSTLGDCYCTCTWQQLSPLYVSRKHPLVQNVQISPPFNVLFHFENYNFTVIENTDNNFLIRGQLIWNQNSLMSLFFRRFPILY